MLKGNKFLTIVLFFAFAFSSKANAIDNRQILYGAGGAAVVGGLIGGLIAAAQTKAAQDAWAKLDQNFNYCVDRVLQQNNFNLNQIITQGILPDDARLIQVVNRCEPFSSSYLKSGIKCLIQDEQSQVVESICNQSYAIGSAGRYTPLTPRQAIDQAIAGSPYDIIEIESDAGKKFRYDKKESDSRKNILAGYLDRLQPYKNSRFEALRIMYGSFEKSARDAIASDRLLSAASLSDFEKRFNSFVKAEQRENDIEKLADNTGVLIQELEQLSIEKLPESYRKKVSAQISETRKAVQRRDVKAMQSAYGKLANVKVEITDTVQVLNSIDEQLKQIDNILSFGFDGKVNDELNTLKKSLVFNNKEFKIEKIKASLASNAKILAPIEELRQRITAARVKITSLINDVIVTETSIEALGILRDKSGIAELREAVSGVDITQLNSAVEAAERTLTQSKDILREGERRVLTIKKIALIKSELEKRRSVFIPNDYLEQIKDLESTNIRLDIGGDINELNAYLNKLEKIDQETAKYVIIKDKINEKNRAIIDVPSGQLLVIATQKSGVYDRKVSGERIGRNLSVCFVLPSSEDATLLEKIELVYFISKKSGISYRKITEEKCNSDLQSDLLILPVDWLRGSKNFDYLTKLLQKYDGVYEIVSSIDTLSVIQEKRQSSQNSLETKDRITSSPSDNWWLSKLDAREDQLCYIDSAKYSNEVLIGVLESRAELPSFSGKTKAFADINQLYTAVLDGQCGYVFSDEGNLAKLIPATSRSGQKLMFSNVVFTVDQLSAASEFLAKQKMERDNEDKRRAEQARIDAETEKLRIQKEKEAADKLAADQKRAEEEKQKLAELEEKKRLAAVAAEKKRLELADCRLAINDYCILRK